QLAQPAAAVVVLLQRLEDDAVDGAGVELHRAALRRGPGPARGADSRGRARGRRAGLQAGSEAASRPSGPPGRQRASAIAAGRRSVSPTPSPWAPPAASSTPRPCSTINAWSWPEPPTAKGSDRRTYSSVK